VYNLGLVGVAIWGGIIAGIRELLFSIIADHTIRTLRTRTFFKTLNLPVAWFDKQENQPDTVTNTVTNSCRALHGFADRYIGHALIILTTVVLCIAGTLIFEWRTGLVALVLIPLMILAQSIQMASVKGLSASKEKIYN
jgi:ABC-type multidrug transport system fused ATPase/permease subunit